MLASLSNATDRGAFGHPFCLWEHYRTHSVDCKVPSVGVTLSVMKKPKPASAPPLPKDSFTKVLASVLSASPAQIQESRAQAKSAKFSSHTRYKYVPAKQS